MSEKEGLDSAVDTTKLILTLDGGLIAFLTGTSFLAHISTCLEKAALVIAMLLLIASLFAGLLVLLQAGTMYSNKDYDLSQKTIKWPGIVNLFAFGLGAASVGALAWLALVWTVSPPEQSIIKVHCEAPVYSGRFDCTGVLPKLGESSKA